MKLRGEGDTDVGVVGGDVGAYVLLVGLFFFEVDAVGYEVVHGIQLSIWCQVTILVGVCFSLTLNTTYIMDV